MKKAIVIFMALKTLVVLLALLIGVSAKAATPSEADAEACRAALEENFNAFNYEDVDRLMASIAISASDAAHREDFRREAEHLFEEEDVYIQLRFWDPFQMERGRLRAMVVQTTTAVGDENGTSTRTDFRTRSNLLPPWRHSYYLQEFIYDAKQKKWLVGAIIGRPRSTFDPAKFPPKSKGAEQAAMEQAASTRCKDGTCSTPLVRLKMK